MRNRSLALLLVISLASCQKAEDAALLATKPGPAKPLDRVTQYLYSKGVKTTWTWIESRSPTTTIGVGMILDQPDSVVIAAEVDDYAVGSVTTQGCVQQCTKFQVDFHKVRAAVWAPVNWSAFAGDGIPRFQAPPAQPEPPCATTAERANEITALVFYTEAAAAEATMAGRPIEAEIRYAEAAANASLQRSGIGHVSLRVLQADKLPEFIEVDPAETLLNHFMKRTDVVSRRNAIGADVVFLVFEGNGNFECGYARLLPSDASEIAKHESQPFAVVRRDCIRCNWSFTHELGHLLGACHDPLDCERPGAFNFEHVRRSDPKWLTVTGNRSKCASCARQMFWSGPKLGCEGWPASDGIEDDVSVIAETAPQVARFRCTE